MGRSPLWTAICETLRAEIAGGHYRAGDRLPTEAELSERFGVNRHTVRRALAALQAEGLVYARRGAGVFVERVQTIYPIGRRVRFHQSVTALGQTPAKRILRLEERFADGREADALRLSEDDRVLIYEGLSLADDVPIAVFRSAFPAARFPNMRAALRDNPSVTAAFRANGLTDFTRASTKITAKRASATLANHLMIARDDPILRTVSINVDAAHIPVEYGRTWFAADRVALTVGDSDL
ncbi:MAG: phosphonate metabolism transcriptional regulator PhnF [Pseudomonadota bacterium]